MGMQQGYTKYGCFSCEWDSNDKANHYFCKEWPARLTYCTFLESKVFPMNHFEPSRCLPTTLHIKLGLMTIFVKVLERERNAFMYLKNKFRNLSDAKIKEGVFIAPEIRAVFQDKNFENKLLEGEKIAWLAFKSLCTNFLGNKNQQTMK